MGAFFYDWPLGISLPLFILVFLGLSWLILLGLRGPVLRAAGSSGEWDRVLGYAISAYGVFYGILLALVAVSVYENFMRVDEAVLAEASAIATFYRDASGYPEPISAELHQLVRHYTEVIVATDFPQLALGNAPAEDDATLAELQRALLAFEPATAGQTALHQNTIQAFNDLVTTRRSRIDMVDLALPPLLWMVLVTGAILNAVLLALVEVKRLRVHLFISGIIAVFVGMLIFVTANMDHPFKGAIAVTADDYQLLLDTFIK